MTVGLLAALGKEHGSTPSAEDLAAYVYALLGGQSYTKRFWNELETPGPRVPMTKDGATFADAVKLGRKLIWLHIYAARFQDKDHGDEVPNGKATTFKGVSSAPAHCPAEHAYDPAKREITVGDGRFGPVPPEVWGFEVSGLKVVQSWLGSAMGRFQTQSEIKRFFESFPNFPRNKSGEVVWQRIVDMMTQPVYTGHICSETYGLNWLKGQHEPLISLDTFDKVQARRNGTAYAPARKNIGDDFACRGVVVCADCNKPLRSSWPKGKTKSYPYYLCQTLNCQQYGKSIPRAKLEGEIGDIIRTRQPTPGLFSLARAMFAIAWEQRRAQDVDVARSGQRRIVELDKQVETLLSRFLEASNATVIRSYVAKVSELERQTLVLAEQMTKQIEQPGKFEKSLELALAFLSNPWKLWETGQVSLRRTVLKLAFSERIKYTRNEGPRTPEISLPFKALTCFSGVNLGSGAVRED